MRYLEASGGRSMPRSASEGSWRPLPAKAEVRKGVVWSRSSYGSGRPRSNGMDPSSPYGIDVPDWKCHPPVNREEESAMKLMRVEVDLAKNVFQVHGVDRSE